MSRQLPVGTMSAPSDATMWHSVTVKSVEIRCSVKGCGGLMARLTLSRLEEGLGHEGFECTSCHRRVKRIPQ